MNETKRLTGWKRMARAPELELPAPSSDDIPNPTNAVLDGERQKTWSDKGLVLEATKPPRIDNIQALRAVAVLFVVARHIQVYTGRVMGGTPSLGQFLPGDLGVDMFFVISGFIMVVTNPRAFTRWVDVVRFLYRRASRIYPMYWFYSVIALGVYLFRPQWLHRLDIGMHVYLVRSFLLWPQAAWPLLGQGWSLVSELYFYVVFAGLLCLPRKWFTSGLLVWAALVLAGAYLLTWLPGQTPPEFGVIFGYLTLEFIAGALAGLFLPKGLAKPTPVRGALFVGLGLLWMALVVLPLGTHPFGAIRATLFGPPCVALVYGVSELEFAGIALPRFLSVIGDWSYSIYLSHIFVIGALARLPLRTSRRGWAEFGQEALWAFAVLLVGMLSYRYLETPLLRLTRRTLPAWRRNNRQLFIRRSARVQTQDRLLP